MTGDVLSLEAWLSSHNDCNAISEAYHGRSLLHCAAFSGSVPCVEALLRYKSIDLNRKDRLGLTPLQCACTSTPPSLSLYSLLSLSLVFINQNLGWNRWQLVSCRSRCLPFLSSLSTDSQIKFKPFRTLKAISLDKTVHKLTIRSFYITMSRPNDSKS